MRSHTIRLTLEPSPGGLYTVTGPGTSGLVTEDQMPDELHANVQEALDALLEQSQGEIC